jgi:hypothetical protein
MFVIDNWNGEQQVSCPKADLLADMPRIDTSPSAMDQFRKVRIQEAFSADFNGSLKFRTPIVCPIVVGRDAVSAPEKVYPGHDMIFSKFVDIMDYAEWMLLAEQVWPPFPKELLDCRTVLERETYYFGTCHAGQSLQVAIMGKISSCLPNFHGESPEIVSAGILTFVIELYEQDSNTRLAVSKVKKLFAVPSYQQSVLRDAERLLNYYRTAE